VELGTGYLVTTDHGTLQATRKVYDLAKKGVKDTNGNVCKLKPILGLEGYLRDDKCPILTAKGIPLDAKGTFSEYGKYYHITLHAMDQEAFETLVRVLSRVDLNRSEKHGQERKPIFTWTDLEELGAKNITMTSSCLAGVVQRHLVDHNDPEMAIAHYEKLRGLCKQGNFYTELFPHVCDSYWQSAVFVTWIDGTEERFQPWKKLQTNSHGNGQIQELAKKLKGRILDPKEAITVTAVMENRKWLEFPPKKLIRIELREGFIKNECRPWAPDGDLQAGCDKFLLYMAERYGDPIIIGDDAHFAKPEEKIVQDIRLQSGGGSWRFHGSYHRQDSEEAFKYFRDRVGVGQIEFEKWVDNSYAWASRFDRFELKTRKSLPTSFYPKDTFAHTMELIDKQGRMDWDNTAWVERLGAEIELLHKNGTIDLLPYFMIAEEVCDLYEKSGELTGPGRGSAAGLLLTYLLGITHVEPLRYKLSMERFLTASRIRSGKLPDVDQDLPHRDLLVDPDKGWLKKRFGNCFAQISVDTTLKLRSSVKDVARVIHGHVPDDIEQLTKDFKNAPQGVEDRDFVFGYEGSDKSWVAGSIESDETLIEYVKKYPKEWEIVQQCLGLARQKSRHACGFVISDTPISDFIPMTMVGGIPVTAYTPKSVEAMGGLKMDFLVVNSLNDIRDCIQLIQDRYGGRIKEARKISGKRVPGQRIVPLPPEKFDIDSFADIWDLPEDQDVFHDICEGKTETVFQFNTNGVLGWLHEFNHIKFTDENGKIHKALDSIESLAALTALDRPGPLDYFVQTDEGSSHNMLVEYARRACGDRPTGNLPILDKLLPETYGVIVYQEQLQRIFQHVGNTSAEEADEFRVHISKKEVSKVIKDRVVFDRGAIPMLGEEQAKQLWDSMETFANYGFNLSHAVCYVVISYACAFLKHHYSLEWWTSVLRNADKNEINDTFWRFCGHLIDLPDVNISGDKFEIKNERIRAPSSLLLGIGEKAHKQLCDGRPYVDINDFCQKNEAFKKAGANTVLDEQGKPVMIEDKKNKGQMVPKVRVGHSALNKTVVGTMIVSGAMNSLFPPGTATTDQLGMYFEAVAKASGKRRVEPVPAKYLNLDSLVRYQMRKAVLPAYSEPLLPLFSGRSIPGFKPQTGTERAYFCRDRAIPFASIKEIERMETVSPWPDDFTVTVAAAAYVVSERRFSWGDGKQAIEYMLDIDGGRLKAVRWANRGQKKMPPEYKEDLSGSVVVALLQKRKENKPFSIDDLIVIQDRLGSNVEESP